MKLTRNYDQILLGGYLPRDYAKKIFVAHSQQRGGDVEGNEWLGQYILILSRHSWMTEKNRTETRKT
jgi:hypothetical protein